MSEKMTTEELVDHPLIRVAPEEDDAERYLIEAIKAIQAEYQCAIEPYIDRLARLHALKRPSYQVDASLLATLKGVTEHE